MNDTSRPVPTGGPEVAYVMTHHPRTALTFIDLEIAELERTGGHVVPIAINEPGAEDLLTEAARRATARTTYLKAQGFGRLGRALVATWLRHPIRTTQLVRIAVSSARLDLSLAARRLAHLADACWAWRCVADTGIRHFHAHFGQTPATIAWFAALVGSLDGTPCTWSFTIHGFQDFADDRVTRLDLKVQSASFVACVSDFTRAQLCRVTDPSAWDRFHVVRCGIDVDAFAFRAPPPPGRRARIVTIARLSPEKGHVVLLDAVHELTEHGVDVELHIVGDGPNASTIERAAAGLGLSDRVTLVGELEPLRVRDELRSADVFCLASFAEGIPISIMEAMAIGVPVVTTYVGGIPELAVDERTALVVPASNSRALATAIRRAVVDGPLRKRLAHAARRLVEERHDVRPNVDVLRSLLESVAGHDDGRACLEAATSTSPP